MLGDRVTQTSKTEPEPGTEQWFINQITVIPAYLMLIRIHTVTLRKRIDLLIVIGIVIAIGVWVR